MLNLYKFKRLYFYIFIGTFIGFIAKDPIRIGTEQKHDETKWFETDGNSKCNWVPVEDLKIFSCPRRISLSGKYDFNNLIPVT